MKKFTRQVVKAFRRNGVLDISRDGAITPKSNRSFSLIVAVKKTLGELGIGSQFKVGQVDGYTLFEFIVGGVSIIKATDFNFIYLNVDHINFLGGKRLVETGEDNGLTLGSILSDFESAYLA